MKKKSLFLLLFCSIFVQANIVRIGPYPGMTDTEEILQELAQTSTNITRIDCDLSQQIIQSANIGTTPFLTASPPFRITVPGQYCVTTEITVPANTNGIVIESNNIIIDLQDRGISGQTGSGIGILVNGVNRSNITIINGAIFNMGGNGIQMNNGGEQIIFENLRLCRNNIGISAFGLRNFLIRDCLISFNRNTGLVLNQFGVILNQNGLIQNVLSSFNQVNGILSSASSNVRFQTIDTSNNAGVGINELNGNRLSFESIQSNNNVQHGIFSNGLGNSFINCITNSNSGVGMWLNGNRITLKDCQSKANNLDGYRITGNNCDITNATSMNNLQIGFNISGNRQAYEECNANENNIGFRIANSSHCILTSLAKGNSTFGFLMLPSSTQCQIRSNTAVANGTVGFQNNTTTVNRIYSNFGSDNPPLPAVAANFVGVPNVVVSPSAVAAINFTANISN